MWRKVEKFIEWSEIWNGRIFQQMGAPFLVTSVMLIFYILVIFDSKDENPIWSYLLAFPIIIVIGVCVWTFIWVILIQLIMWVLRKVGKIRAESPYHDGPRFIRGGLTTWEMQDIKYKHWKDSFTKSLQEE